MSVALTEAMKMQARTFVRILAFLLLLTHTSREQVEKLDFTVNH